MWIAIAQAAAGLAMLYFGGEWLIRGASALASRMGISALAIGLTVVAFGTSTPELVVSLDAALSDANDISVGNVVGSNIANIALILGFAAMLRPASVVAKVVRVDSPIMLVVSLVLIGVMFDGQASRVEGGFLVLGLLSYTGFTFWEAHRESEVVQQEFASVAPEVRAGGLVAVGLIFLGLTLLVVGGHLLVTSAVRLATLIGISQAAIGLTIVAVGTSLPELATSVIASLRGQGDIAIGNVVGSNIFNILGILGVTAIVQPLRLGAISWRDLAVMAALAALLPMLLGIRRRLGRAEGGLLFAGYLLYAGWLLAG